MNHDASRVMNDAIDDTDEGLMERGGLYLISDREVDQLADAELGWERWERTRRWWLLGCIEDSEGINAA